MQTQPTCFSGRHAASTPLQARPAPAVPAREGPLHNCRRTQKMQAKPWPLCAALCAHLPAYEAPAPPAPASAHKKTHNRPRRSTSRTPVQGFAPAGCTQAGKAAGPVPWFFARRQALCPLREKCAQRPRKALQTSPQGKASKTLRQTQQAAKRTETPQKRCPAS